MNIFENILSSMQSIMGSKMRSLLTMFGIIVGIGSVMMITSIGEGYRQSMTQEFDAMGLDLVTITTTTRDGLHRIETHDLLTLDDVEMLRLYEDLLDVTANMTVSFWDSLERADGEMNAARLTGTDDAYFRMNNTVFLYGRPLIEQDLIAQAQVAVMNVDDALLVFGRADVVGETVLIDDWGGGLELTIIGVTESTLMSEMEAVFSPIRGFQVPITLVQTRYNGGVNIVGSISVQVADMDRLTEISENVIRIIEFDRGTEGRYNAQSMMEIFEEFDMVIGLFTLFMSVVAGISLLVGGIGVMNIMLVSVTERTREIGIRKSLGATNWNIQFQFLVEAVILTAIGGAIGILFGYAGGSIFAIIAEMMTGMPVSPYISVGTVAFVVFVSAIIGIVFGVYPASKAAKLDPIEALRFE